MVQFGSGYKGAAYNPRKRRSYNTGLIVISLLHFGILIHFVKLMFSLKRLYGELFVIFLFFLLWRFNMVVQIQRFF